MTCTNRQGRSIRTTRITHRTIALQGLLTEATPDLEISSILIRLIQLRQLIAGFVSNLIPCIFEEPPDSVIERPRSATPQKHSSRNECSNDTMHRILS